MMKGLKTIVVTGGAGFISSENIQDVSYKLERIGVNLK